ncbi:MAG: tRNA (N6-isopentenyl adenosine(37)-C2)-methylthiotransferase MiaB [Proteobacteria bacterium]|nr:tRNA (N6-isopentenyl adenosine(37)-C2)-methylthiotransferase MiaB [Pseudomonadota bacterium]MBU1686522.1 tRNA (N6-isopentenyl adenosine(37)-C2)-methylthiotransferase MiaB [Pseudomonadota bacterium]
MQTKQAYIETFGCQMNDRDSEIMGQLLEQAGYSLIDNRENAALIVVNTCSIRGKAEQKAMSLLGGLRKAKKLNPDLIVAVTGCVAQQEGEKLQERMPHIDLVVGPQNIYQLPRLIDTVRSSSKPSTAIEQTDNFLIPSFLPNLESPHSSPFRRFVTIMQGCNNFCTYCVVPHTRGREVSRSPRDILAEVNHLITKGVKEITLLGQNVNSYGLDRRSKGENYPDFPNLLRMVASTDGLIRIRFTTSNPKDLSRSLMNCFIDLPKLCPHFHLPVQSGSDRILKKMNRKYTVASYLDLVAELRTIRPDITLTTDIIVGFPGETDEDFEGTMQLLEKIRYHGAFSFKYSDRPHTVSAGFSDKVAEEVKSERLSRLQERQKQITLERNSEFVGQVLEVMVESQEQNTRGQWCGRSAGNLIVNFTGGTNPRQGELYNILIEKECLHSLRGLIQQQEGV